MNYNELNYIIIKILKNSFNVQVDEIDSDMAFRELGLDSLDMVKFTVELEKYINDKISDEEMMRIFYIKDVFELVKNKH